MRKKLSELQDKQKDAYSSLQLQKQQTSKLKLIEKEMETMKREKVSAKQTACYATCYVQRVILVLIDHNLLCASTLATSQVDLVKRLKEDATQHREWKQKQELELRQLRRTQQKTQFELTKLENVREKQEIVLKRKHEEVAAAKKRVKELDRKARAGNAGKGRLLPAGDMSPSTVNTWLTQQVSECANEAAMRSSLKIEMMKRRALANKLSKDDLDDETTESLKEQLQFRCDFTSFGALAQFRLINL